MHDLSSSRCQQLMSLLTLDGICLLTRTELQLLRAQGCMHQAKMVGLQDRVTATRLISMVAHNMLVSDHRCSLMRLVNYRVGKQNRCKNADIVCVLKLLSLSANLNQ